MNERTKRMEIQKEDGYKVLKMGNLTHLNKIVGFWIAEITGNSEQYKFEREFVNGWLRDSKNRKRSCLKVSSLKVGKIYQLRGGSHKNEYNKFFKVEKQDEEEIEIKLLKEGEVVEYFSDETKEEKQNLISEINEQLKDMKVESLQKVKAEVKQ